MADTFSFAANNFGTFDVLGQTQPSKGDASGTVNDPGHFSAIASTAVQAIDSKNDVDLFALPLAAGVPFTFDIDFGFDADPVDVAITIVDSTGKQVAINDDGNVNDRGSPGDGTLDSLLTFTPAKTGVYFVAVHQFFNVYFNKASISTTSASTAATISSTCRRPRCRRCRR